MADTTAYPEKGNAASVLIPRPECPKTDSTGLWAWGLEGLRACPIGTAPQAPKPSSGGPRFGGPAHMLYWGVSATNAAQPSH